MASGAQSFYELYRRSSIGLALTDTLDDLISEERINPQLAMKILGNFDQAITEALQKNVKSRLQFKGSLDTYRFCDEVWTFLIKNVTFKMDNGSQSVQADKVKISRLVVECFDLPFAQRSGFKVVMAVQTHRPRGTSSSPHDMQTSRPIPWVPDLAPRSVQATPSTPTYNAVRPYPALIPHPPGFKDHGPPASRQDVQRRSPTRTHHGLRPPDSRINPHAMDHVRRRERRLRGVQRRLCKAGRTTTELTSTLAHNMAAVLSLSSHENIVEVAVRAIFFGLNLTFNGIMWTLFTKALAKGTSTTQVSIINTSTNFMLTALLGLFIFAEALPPLWWAGASLLVAGNVIVGRKDEDGDEDAPGEVGGEERNDETIPLLKEDGDEDEDVADLGDLSR
ncbi:transcription initiation factor IIA small subunit [Metarhizium acridum CQMa 102]|uniref:Transcription initiation factor IIA subunit 2 n=1 Tax=Metarhizium acridum (strain CQMa 102) TaxID=655827 RepID=E9EA47_METAQ|nr:transcription initiation factor IIA small subunit [Metarhizium acridum CQMa 102]EFY87185.1 transcription initiation factor IIA small subunit [Metarhizium acridum CQMa 102]